MQITSSCNIFPFRKQIPIQGLFPCGELHTYLYEQYHSYGTNELL